MFFVEKPSFYVYIFGEILVLVFLSRRALYLHHLGKPLSHKNCIHRARVIPYMFFDSFEPSFTKDFEKT